MEIISQNDLENAIPYIGEEGADSARRAGGNGARVFFYRQKAILREQMQMDGIFSEKTYSDCMTQMSKIGHALYFVFQTRQHFGYCDHRGCGYAGLVCQDT